MQTFQQPLPLDGQANPYAPLQYPNPGAHLPPDSYLSQQGIYNQQYDHHSQSYPIAAAAPYQQSQAPYHEYQRLSGGHGHNGRMSAPTIPSERGFPSSPQRCHMSYDGPRRSDQQEHQYPAPPQHYEMPPPRDRLPFDNFMGYHDSLEAPPPRYEMPPPRNSPPIDNRMGYRDSLERPIDNRVGYRGVSLERVHNEHTHHNSQYPNDSQEPSTYVEHAHHNSQYPNGSPQFNTDGYSPQSHYSNTYGESPTSHSATANHTDFSDS